MSAMRTRKPRSSERSAWTSMIQRCFNKRHRAYARYGGRGICVCQSWRNSFDAFFRDMGLKPQIGRYSLDRIDNDGNYEPSNCRWATASQQNNNTSVTVSLTAFGRIQTLTEWSKERGLSKDTIRQRLARGWTVEESLSPELTLARGSRCGSAKLTEQDVAYIRSHCVRRGDNKRMAKKFGVCVCTISYIKTGKRWKHVA